MPVCVYTPTQHSQGSLPQCISFSLAFFSNFPYSLLCSRPLHLLPNTFARLVLAPNEKTKENKLDAALMTFEALFRYYRTEQSL